MHSFLSMRGTLTALCRTIFSGKLIPESIGRAPFELMELLILWIGFCFSLLVPFDTKPYRYRHLNEIAYWGNLDTNIITQYQCTLVWWSYSSRAHLFGLKWFDLVLEFHNAFPPLPYTFSVDELSKSDRVLAPTDLKCHTIPPLH